MKNNISLLLIVFFFISCSQHENKVEQGNAVSGSFSIFVDRNSYPLLNVLKQSYLAIYPEVVINIDTGNGNQMLSRLSSRQVQAAITSEPISKKDSLTLSSAKLFFHQFQFATDAIAIIVNKSDSSKIQSLSDPELLLTDCNHESGINICTTNPGSDINSSIGKLIPGATKCMSGWINAETKEGVFNLVTSKTGYAGLVQWSIMSDSGDPVVKNLRNSVYIARLRGAKSPSSYYTPVQSNIAEAEYPLVQKLYLVTSEAYSGPASGFAAFIASQEGQRIISLFGLVPSKMPSREIVIP